LHFVAESTYCLFLCRFAAGADVLLRTFFRTAGRAYDSPFTESMTDRGKWFCLHIAAPGTSPLLLSGLRAGGGFDHCPASVAVTGSGNFFLLRLAAGTPAQSLTGSGAACLTRNSPFTEAVNMSSRFSCFI